ncbi:MAG: hypothetical protein C6H99_00835, partial [Epsilonproteobacteria bacterium]|nr:hypothetical protein [Campylobacterota bacterium]
MEAPKRSVDLRSVLSGYDYLNALRQKAGLVTLSRNVLLEQAAQNHSDYMVKNNYPNHTERESDPGYTGTDPGERALYVGYPSRMVLENLSFGRSYVYDAIDSLMSAIYHRFVFLNEWIDEIGIGYAQDSSFSYTYAYTFDMGNSKIAYLCSDEYPDFDGEGAYVYGICADEQKKIAKQDYIDALGSIGLSNASIILWPYKDATDIPPVFYEESPDPLPECSVSGYPVSVKFNTYKTSSQPSLVEFALYEDEEQIDDIKILTYNSDPNGLFSGYEFALMPLRRLKWGGHYSVLFTYEIDGDVHTIRWGFTTKDLPYDVIQIGADRSPIVIESDKMYALYFIPQDCNDQFESLSYRYDSGVESVELFAYDRNTLILRAAGGDGARIEILVNGEVLEVELGSGVEETQSSSSIQSSSSESSDVSVSQETSTSSANSSSSEEISSSSSNSSQNLSSSSSSQTLSSSSSSLSSSSAQSLSSLSSSMSSAADTQESQSVSSSLSSASSAQSSVESVDEERLCEEKGYIWIDGLCIEAHYASSTSSEIATTSFEAQSSSIDLSSQQEYVEQLVQVLVALGHIPIQGYFAYYGPQDYSDPYAWVYLSKSQKV